MNLPFSPEDFFSVFRHYNEAIYPMQWVLYLLAAAVIVLMMLRDKRAGRLISVILAFFWLWMGIGYHWLSFSQINPAAKIFAVLYILQAVLFLIVAIKGRLEFDRADHWRLNVGYALIIIGTVIYPVVGYFLGHRFPEAPTFGLPCPTTIFTLGVLMAAARCPKYLVIIPFIWSLIGFSAALALGVQEDILLLLAGLVAFSAIIIRPRRVALA